MVRAEERDAVDCVTSIIEYAVTADDPALSVVWPPSGQLAVFKATGNPTGDDGKAVNAEVWDLLLGFKVFLAGCLSSARGTSSAKCKVTCDSPFHGLVNCLCESLGAAYYSATAISVLMKRGRGNANLSVSAKMYCKSLLMYTAVVGTTLLLMFNIPNPSSGIDAF